MLTRSFSRAPVVRHQGTLVRCFDGARRLSRATNLLFYVQGGAAWTQAKATAFNAAGAEIGSVSGNSRTGWTAGGGVEWMFVPHWSVFLEDNYMGFGTRSSSFAVCPAGTTCGIFSAKANVQDVLVGVNYRF